MLNIKRFEVNPFQENCYIVSDDSKECVIIDCGAFYDSEREAITSYITSNGLVPKHLLCTHAHIDHCIGNNTIYERFGLKPELHGGDERLMGMLPQQAKMLMQYTLDFDMPPVGKYLTDNDVIEFGSHSLSIIHTPGHTPGGVVYYCKEENIAFSGDTLFRMSIGRTDFYLGDFNAMQESLNTLLTTLPDNTTVYCGHGPQTSIGDEKAMNPYYERR